jgi:hypothetical protein
VPPTERRRWRRRRRRKARGRGAGGAGREEVGIAGKGKAGRFSVVFSLFFLTLSVVRAVLSVLPALFIVASTRIRARLLSSFFCKRRRARKDRLLGPRRFLATFL